MGRHARTIRLGRNIWESPPLEAEVTRFISEHFFDSSFPPLKEVKQALAQAKNLSHAPAYVSISKASAVIAPLPRWPTNLRYFFLLKSISRMRVAHSKMRA